MHLKTLASIDTGQRLGQCRAAPVHLGAGQPGAFVAAYAADFDVDPFTEMFFFPTDTLKLAAYTVEGELLWRRDLGRGVVPGMWFTPVLPVDLDGDGVDEIFLVGNRDASHPLSLGSRELWRLDARTGATTGSWAWPVPRPHWGESLSHQNRNFLLAGRGRDGRLVLVTAQGTYAHMALQGWEHDGAGGLRSRWSRDIGVEDPGARGSHMCAVVDWDGDGADEFFWGERLLRCDDGEEIWCADRATYDGHSDVVQPIRVDGRGSGAGWMLFTCRETEESNYQRPGHPRVRMPPRVAVYGARGERVWGALDTGHMDMGWVARVGPERRALACSVRIGKKTCGPDGRMHEGKEEFFWDALSGSACEPGIPAYKTLPVDLDGDGRHEFVRGAPGGDGEVFDATGRSLGCAGGAVAIACRFVPGAPGEQVLVYRADGRLTIVGAEDAEDSADARARYEHPYYAANARLTSTGSNLVNLGGL